MTILPLQGAVRGKGNAVAEADTEEADAGRQGKGPVGLRRAGLQLHRRRPRSPTAPDGAALPACSRQETSLVSSGLTATRAFPPTVGSPPLSLRGHTSGRVPRPAEAPKSPDPLASRTVPSLLPHCPCCYPVTLSYGTPPNKPSVVTGPASPCCIPPGHMPLFLSPPFPQDS